MLNPPVFMKTHGKYKFRREPSSPNSLNWLVKGTVLRELWNQRGNTGWPGFTAMTWTPWHFWQLDTKVNTITATGPLWAASSGEHTQGQHGKHWPRHSACPEQCAGLREDAVLHTAHLQGTQGVTPAFAQVCPARAALGWHSRGCASCQTQWQWPCGPWHSSWGHKSLGDACSVPAWAAATRFRRCWGLTNASAIRQKLKPRVLTFTWELLHLQSKFITKHVRGFFAWVCFKKSWTSLEILGFIHYIARISISCCLCNLKRRKKTHKNWSPHNPVTCFKMESFITLVKIRCRSQLIRCMYICIYTRDTDIWLWFAGKWSVEPFRNGFKRSKISGV